MKRITCFFITLCFAAVLLTAPVAAGNDFIITFWTAPPTDLPDAFGYRYEEIAEAGFNLAMPSCSPATLKDNLAILDACAKNGLKVVIADERIMARDPGDPEFEKNLDAVIADYAKHPALYGYHLIDEPGPGLFPKLAAINAYLLKKDPKRVPYVNLFPNYVDPAWIGGSYPQHVEQFLSTVKPKLLSYDHYALFENSERDIYFDNLEVIRTAAMKHNVPWMNIILVTPHFGYRNPSEADLRWQVYTTLAYGGNGISYFTYWTIKDYFNFRNGVLESDGKRTEHYEMVKRLNGEMRTLAPLISKLRSTGVTHTTPVPKGTQQFTPNDLFKRISGAGITIGEFTGSKGSRYVMLVNDSPRKLANVVVTLSDVNTELIEVNRTNGREEPLKRSSYGAPGLLKLNFQPGEGRMFRIGTSK